MNKERMESESNDASNLLMGILRDNKQELRNLEEGASSYARSQREAAEKQAQKILKDSIEAAEAQRAAILKRAESRVAVECRKSALRARDRIMQEAVNKALAQCREKIRSPEYAALLKGWIVEAAVGLSSESATVNASRDESVFITDTTLREAEAEVRELTGKTVRLRRDAGEPLSSQGVVLTADDGRLAFNNQISTRSLRLRNELQKLIYEALFN